MSTELEEKVTSSLVDGRLPCAVAFEIAKTSKVNRQQVGEMANKLKIRIVNCQLGFFQLEKATHADIDGMHIKEPLAEEIKASLVNDFLSCAVVFKIARKLNITPREVGDAATKQKIRIANCQLGCFP